MAKVLKSGRDWVVDYCLSKNLEELDTSHLLNLRTHLNEIIINEIKDNGEDNVDTDSGDCLVKVQDIIKRRQTLTNLL